MEILVPVPKTEDDSRGLPPRLGSLEGTVCGLVLNEWLSLEPTYDEVKAVLPELYGVAGFVEKKKLNSAPLAAADLDDLAERCQAAIVGLSN